MQTTKLVFLVLIGLAMIEFSIGQSLNAATSAKAKNPSFASIKRPTSPASTVAKSAQSAQAMQGIASVYADKFNGRKTASGQKMRQDQLTAAHRSLPIGTTVCVTNLRNRKSVNVRINDRGPQHKGRVIDLSSAAAAELGMLRAGIVPVKLEVVRADSINRQEG